MRMPRITPIALAAVLCPASGFAADPSSIDWRQVPARTLTLFYPGQSTFQWLRSAAHPGATLVRENGACIACHTGQEAALGSRIVKGGPLEPTPPQGKNGSLELTLQVAYDKENAYFRAQWKTNKNYAGSGYPYYRFEGKEWKPYGAPRLSPPAYKGEQPAIYEDRFSMMIDDGAVPNFASQGCWLTCHNGERDAPGQPKAAEVAAHPFYQAIKRADVRKYLPATRSDPMAGWDKTVSVEQVSRQKAEGRFLDLIQWRAHRTNIVGQADDGYVLEWRNFDAGANAFASNMDPKTRQPRYMFDAAKAGRKGFSDVDRPQNGGILVLGDNAVPFDADAGWKPGDLLPQYFIAKDAAKGSAADNKQARGEWNDGRWTVVLARPLNLKNADDKPLSEGRPYHFGFAVHDDNITTRGHHVSFPVTIGFGAKADIEATRLP